MTEGEWLACEDPKLMLEFLRGKVTSRRIWGEDHPFTRRNALELANLYLWLQDYDQAERLFLACYQQLEAPLP
jgi:hypothetical protein